MLRPNGVGVAGADVVVRERIEDHFGTNTAHVTADERGRFALRIFCILACPPDTLQYWVRASANGVFDIAATTLHFARVGEVPQSVSITITFH